MYESTTNGVRVRATPKFQPDQSAPEQDYYFWAYEIDILNLGATTLQLRTRTWTITDGNGRVERVHGKGVVGQTPTLSPGQSFNYSSGCPLRTPQGIMVGHYDFEDEDGNTVSVNVPAFSLDSPYARNLAN